MQGSVPIKYRVAFLYVEPAIILMGAYLALFEPQAYLTIVHATTYDSQLNTPATAATIPAVSVLLAQLANVYVLFALIASTVLPANHDYQVWRAFLRAALVADFGHLLVVAGQRVEVDWATLGRFSELGVADWGKHSTMIVLKIAFLMGDWNEIHIEMERQGPKSPGIRPQD